MTSDDADPGDVIKVDFAAQNEARSEDPHVAGPCRCINCAHEWEGVAPAGTTQLECPECGTQKGVFVYPFMDRWRPLWRCGCGNDFFVVHDTHFVCAHCGAKQEFPRD